MGIGAAVEITCSANKSAILILPDGASCEHLWYPEDFLNRLTDDIMLSWLESTYSSSVVLVTGCVKSRSWGVAAVENGSRETSVSLTFGAAKVGGNFTGAYTWQNTSAGHQRAGPQPKSIINVFSFVDIMCLHGRA